MEKFSAKSAAWARRALRAVAIPENVPGLQRFFRTGPGEYGEGDRFLGVKVPAVRQVLRETGEMAESEVLALLASPWHEERLLALLMLVRQSERGTPEKREALAQLYLAHARHINNWDLVDTSAPQILGGWVLESPAQAKVLRRLIGSRDLWEQRMAMVATQKLIRAAQTDLTFELAERLLTARHDLLHKAAGWMLREAGARQPEALTAFLHQHGPIMPRTMLRYAIEHRSAEERQGWLAKK